jgi:hypothetical protein
MNVNPTSPFKLSVFCANVHRSNHIHHSILQAHANPDTSNTNIIIITEPWIGTVRADTQEKGTVRHPDWQCIVPMPVSQAGVALYYRKSAQFRVNPLLHEPFKHNHIITARLSMDEFPLLLFAVYNSPSTFDATDFLQDLILPEEPAILCGDFNLHSPEWDTTVLEENARAKAFEDWMADNSLRVLNDPNKPTYHGHHFEYAKVDDLVIANIDAIEYYDVSPIRVHTDDHFASDHYPISFELNTFTNAPPLTTRTVFSDHNSEKWMAEITPLLTRLLVDTPQQPSPEQLDALADSIINAINTATQRSMKTAGPPSHHAHHWWNNELEESLTELRRQAQGVKATQNPYLRQLFERTKGVFRAKVRHAKRTWATQKLEGASSNTVWEFIKWYKHGGKRSRPLYSSPSHVPAASDQERTHIFSQHFFQSPHPLAHFT